MGHPVRWGRPGLSTTGCRAPQGTLPASAVPEIRLTSVPKWGVGEALAQSGLEPPEVTCQHSIVAACSVEPTFRRRKLRHRGQAATMWITVSSWLHPLAITECLASALTVTTTVTVTGNSEDTLTSPVLRPNHPLVLP